MKSKKPWPKSNPRTVVGNLATYACGCWIWLDGSGFRYCGWHR